MTYDILIKDGTILDGSGKPRFRGDIGVSNGRIKDIGNPILPGATGAKTISAFGKFVTPGFIDITSHADQNWSLFQNPMQDYLLTQGVTTILVGNCGSSLAPLPSKESVDSLRKWTTESGANINWLTLGEFLAELGRHPLGVNVATLVGHGTIRRGITKGETRPLTIEEIQQFVEVLERSLAQGAFGLSTGLLYSHESAATADELIVFARTLANSSAVYKTHLRSEGLNLIPAVNEALQIARSANVTVVASHLKAIGRKAWRSFKDALEIIARAKEGNAKFYFDISPYQRTGSFLYLLLPLWAREGGFSDMLLRIGDPEGRKKIEEGLERLTLHYDRYIVANSVTASVNGKTIAEIAERAGVRPEETVLDLLLANRGRVTVFGKTLASKNIEMGIRHPLGIIASDASGISADLGRTGKLVHPRSSGAFPHFLHKFVREKELVSWEEGIYKISGLPAEAVGFKERGRIEKKYHADIVVFDPEKIRDQSTYHNPFVHSTGVEAVIINGKLAIENGELTGVAAGEVVKKS